MVFLGLEKPVEYGAQQIFDPTMANMVLQAQQQYNEAARKEYERGLEDFDKFTTKYGDFISPFAKDMARYGEMIGGIQNVVDQAYKDGVDLLRSPEGRMLVHRLTNSIDPKEFNMMRANAKLGYAYLDALKDLAAKGKSSKELEDYIASLPGNVAFDQFSTKENGTWNRMPTEYSTLQQFVHPSFANLKPHLLTKQEAMSRVGAEYDPRADYRGITKADMEASMRDALPGLTGNALYGFYRDQARKQLIASGNTNPTEEQINEQFVQNAVTADHQMMMPLDSDYGRYYNEQNLSIKRQNLALRRAIAAAKSRGDNGGPGTQQSGISLAQSWYDTAMAKAYSADGYTKDWDKMHLMYGDFSRDAGKVFYDFGQKYKGGISPISDAELDLIVKQSGTDAERDIINRWKNLGLNNRSKSLNDEYNKIKRKYTSRTSGVDAAKRVNEAYRQQFSIPMDGKSVAEIIGTPLNDNKMVAKIGEGAVDKIYGLDDVVSNTAGYTKTHTTADTNKIRAAIKKWGVNNTTITSMERGYGSLRKNTGSFEVNPEVKIVCTDDNGNVQFVGYGYYDIGLGSNSTKGGAYLGDYKTTGGAIDLGNMTGNQPRLNISNNMYRGPIKIGAQRIPGLVYTPEYSAQETNMFPDYNRWTAFGVWDTDLTSKRLHGKASEYLGTYGNVYTGDDTDDLLLDDEE